METPVIIPTGTDSLCGLLYEPAGAPRGGIVMCHPLFEERKSAHRVMVEAARALAAAGFAVLRFDYRGCGDSRGEFATFGCADWRADIAAAAAFLADRISAPHVGLLGVRLGASLALESLAAIPNAAFVVLWEPVLSGRRYLDQELRRKLIKEMVTFGQSRVTRAALVKDLEDGKTVDLDGYPLTPGLFAAINAIELPALVTRAPKAVLMVGIGAAGAPSRDLTALQATLAAGGAAVDVIMAAENPFWNQVGLVECPDLIARTREWVEGRGSGGERLTVNAPRSTLNGAQTRENGPSVPNLDVERWTLSVERSLDSSERPICFRVGESLLHGVLHEPAGTQAGPVVVFLHGWAGSRIGPHRMFVPLARRLAVLGCACLRFDFRGRGDSEGVAAAATIRGMIEDTRAALDLVAARYPGRPLVLLGICSGGKVAVATAAADPRVGGLALWSAEPMGPMRGVTGQTRKSAGALRTYARKLLRPETWRKLITFRVNMRMVRKAVTNEETASRREIEDETRWLAQWRGYRGPVLFIYGSNDPETPAAKAGYTALCRDANIVHEWHDIEGANHSFYSIAWEREVLDLSEAWIRRRYMSQ